MTLKITDPVSFLRNTVSKKGYSDVYGVYATGVNVIADALVDYGYEVDSNKIETDICNLLSRQETKWNQTLVNTRIREKEIVHPIIISRIAHDVTIYFLTEDHDISCLVFIPELEVIDLASEITFYQRLLKYVADFAGKSPTTVRFTIGAAKISWFDMVEQGYAKEVELGW